VLSEFLGRPFVFHRWNASYFHLIAVKIFSDIICNFGFLSHDNIMCGWNKHFGQLAQKSDYEKFDIKFLELIEKEREIITQICEEKYIHKEVTIGLANVKKIFSSETAWPNGAKLGIDGPWVCPIQDGCCFLR
jgi:hypothetical protein